MLVDGSENETTKTAVQAVCRTQPGGMSALGALIVFATFLVKDRFEEKWKSEAEAIEFARAFYDIRADSASLLNSVQGITEFVLPQLLSAGDVCVALFPEKVPKDESA